MPPFELSSFFVGDPLVDGGELAGGVLRESGAVAKPHGRSYSGAFHRDAVESARFMVCGATADKRGLG